MYEHDSNLPRHLGRYEVVGPLASGGMAEVLLARLTGPEGFERVVVVKRILPHLARIKEFVEMFADEARIIAGIRHPNVVAVHELCRDHGELFLVLEYLEGESAAGLARRLAMRDLQLDTRLSIHIVSEACAGLHAAHELTDVDGARQGLVHRDVSPQNVFITYGGAVKVLDFGIAKVADRMTRTEAGQVKGKFQYMSPEQASGKALDRRSDIFALGIVLYEMSTGHRLFKRATELMSLKAICDEPIPRPSALFRDYPAALEAVVVRALERDPSRRFQTALDMRRALLHVVEDLAPSGELPEEALAKLMGDCFADRIEVKSEMLRRMRAGSAPTVVPAAEADDAIEIPSVFGEETLASTAPSRPGTRAGWRAGGLAAAGLMLLVVCSFELLVALRRPASTSREARAEAVASAATDATTTASSATTAPARATVAVQIETIPSGAVASAASLGRDGRCITPCALSLERSVAPTDIVVEKAGFAQQRESVLPDVDQRIRLTLQVVEARGTTSTRRTAGVKAPPTPPVFQRFD
jgi:eukaryotic-like serine/threonine-protein kinase